MTVHSTVDQLLILRPGSRASLACMRCGTQPQDSHASTHLGQMEPENPGWAHLGISSSTKGRLWSVEGQRDRPDCPPSTLTQVAIPEAQGPKSKVLASHKPAGPQGKAYRDTSFSHYSQLTCTVTVASQQRGGLSPGGKQSHRLSTVIPANTQ